jgi:hypothetical protein
VRSHIPYDGRGIWPCLDLEIIRNFIERPRSILLEHLKDQERVSLSSITDDTIGLWLTSCSLEFPTHRHLSRAM